MVTIPIFIQQERRGFVASISFLWVPVTAMICYLLLLAALLPVAKQRAVGAFCWLLAGLVCWTGGSMLMRMFAWPGSMFWYELSLASLLCLPALLYHFIAAFFRWKKAGERQAVPLLTLLAVLPGAANVYLDQPVVEYPSAGHAVFLYNPDWRILIPTLLCGAVLLLAVRIIWKNSGTAGFSTLVLGMMILAIGNLASILPANVFPFDTLAGIFNAILLFWALYRQRLFQLRIFLSVGSVSLMAGLVVSVCCLPVLPFIEQFRPLRDAKSMLYLLLWSAGALLTVLLTQLFYWMAQRFILAREKQRALVLQQLSASIAANPGREGLLRQLLEGLEQLYGAIPAGIFLLDPSEEHFVPVYPPKLAELTEPLDRNSPLAARLAEVKQCVSLQQLCRGNRLLPPSWERQLRQMRISYILPFLDQEQMLGIMFLGFRQGDRNYSRDDLMFFDSLGTIVSVGLNNARLYDQLYQEARTDQLTGLLNRRAFSQALENQIALGEPFALVLLDLDDLKLYNQVYGFAAGDRALQRIAGMLREQAGENSICARYGGKEFMVILPGASGEDGLTMARNMGTAIGAPTDETLCGLTFSSGVYGYTGGSVTAGQMIEYVDMAVFQVKATGKNSVRLYGKEDVPGKVAIGQQSYTSTIYAITAAIDAKDHYTFSHSQNVANYARALAQALGMDEVHVEMLYQAGLVHDVGKLAIPEHILSKPGALTAEEYEIMKGHVEKSVAIIRNLPTLDYVLPAAVSHHERWDGKGYPRGLAGNAIPLGGRCLALADAFDAMTSSRIYKPSYHVEAAVQQLRDCSGTQFDPELCQVFIRLVEEGVIRPDSSNAAAAEIIHS